MKVYLEMEVQRVEGKQLSAEAVGEELAADLEGHGLSVDDSEFEVVSATHVAQPRPVKQALVDESSLRLVAERLVPLYEAEVRHIPFPIMNGPLAALALRFGHYREAGYQVTRYSSTGGWLLLDPDGAALMIGNQGCVSTRKADAEIEAYSRIAMDRGVSSVACPNCGHVL